MDVFYPIKQEVRSGSATAELQYSLRSLRNLPHDRVVIAGWLPEWCVNVEHVATLQRGSSKFVNALDNLKAALPLLSDEFVLFNDDFYVLEPISAVPMLHREQWDANERIHAPTGARQFARATVRKFLVELQIAPIYSYELHLPMPIHKPRLIEALQRAGDRFVAGYHRTLYGNLFNVGGEQAVDVKIDGNRPIPVDWKFVSSSDRSFHNAKLGQTLRELFPDPSPYERQ